MREFFLYDNEIGLRNLELDDCIGGYVNWFNDANVCEYNDHHRYPVTKDELEAFISSLINDRSRIVLAVELINEGIHIGNISLQRIDMVNRQAEIAFVFGETQYWGKGYATKAAKLLIDHAFIELGLNRVYFGTSKMNIGMQRVGEKLGFTRGGKKASTL